jgi:FkbM family methyltransferase
LRLSPTVARAVILLSDYLADAARGPLAAPMRPVVSVMSNRVVPRVARSSFRPGLYDVNGVNLLIPDVPGIGTGGEFHMALGTYERREVEFLRRTLAPGSGFVDVGAHIGYFTTLAASLVGSGGRVIALEPTPQSAATLRQNVEANAIAGAVTVIEAAASSEPGRANLNVSDNSGMRNTLEEGTLEDSTTSIEVDVTTVDAAVAAAGSPSIDVIKMDVEGHERSVISGASVTLRDNPAVSVMFEVSGGSESRNTVSAGTISCLADLGFSFRTILRDGSTEAVTIEHLHARMAMPRWQDSLFNVVAIRPPVTER